MTPGEVKGYLSKLLWKKDLDPKEKQALELALDAVDAIMFLSPHFYEASKKVSKK